jgi:uncharacterized protein
MAKMVLFGASGMVGQRALSEALQRGYQVTAVVRDPSKVETKHPSLTVTTGDVTDPATVTRLADGSDVVVNAVSQRTPGTDPVAAYQAIGRSLTDGLRALGDKAPRLVVVGGAGTLEVAPGSRLVDQPGFPDAYKPEALAHAALLDQLRDVHDVQWSYLSPSAELAPGPRTGSFRLGGDTLLSTPDGKSFVTAEDYVIALLDECESGAHIGKRFTVGY